MANSQPELKRFIMTIRTFTGIAAVLFAAVTYTFLNPNTIGSPIFNLGIFVCLSALIIASIILLLLGKQIKTIFQDKQDAQQALLKNQIKYKSIVDNIQIGFARSTPGDLGSYIEVNPFFAQMLGYTKEELIQMPIAELYEDRQKRKLFSDRLCREDRIKDVEVVFCKKDGSLITLSVTGMTVRNEMGDAEYFDLIIEDVTDKQFHHDEAVKNEKLTSIGVLAGGIAHDFNNILTGLYGNIALAKLEVEPDSDAAGLISDAEESMTKATDLTQQLLVFAKGGDPVKESINIAQTVKDAARFNLAGSNIRLETIFDDQINPVHADPTQINEVVASLVVNARQAMPDGGVLSITATNIRLDKNQVAALEKGEYVRIMVQDQGIGIPDDCMPKIFDPYFTTKHAGSGMGLANCFSIIKNHNGWITAASEAGKGAVFTLYLPAGDAAEGETLDKTIPVVGEIESANILIMDDDLQVCDITRKMIALFGFKCDTVHNGSHAIEAYRQAMAVGDRYDLVLMDLTIPGGMGGKEAIVKLLDVDPNVNAVVISGYTNDPVMSDYATFGFKGCLVKPFKINALKETIETVMKTQ